MELDQLPYNQQQSNNIKSQFDKTSIIGTDQATSDSIDSTKLPLKSNAFQDIDNLYQQKLFEEIPCELSPKFMIIQYEEDKFLNRINNQRKYNFSNTRTNSIVVPQKINQKNINQNIIQDCDYSPEFINQQNNILWKACQTGDIFQIYTILNQPKIQFYISFKHSPNNFTLLHLAVIHEQFDIIYYLIHKGANINSQTSNGYTPLHLAVINGSFVICKLLVLLQADINSQDYSYSTPINCASQKGYYQIVQFLIQHGANQYIKNIYGITPPQNTLDIHIRRLFPIDNDNQNKDSFQERTIFQGTIRPNSRADYVNKLLNVKTEQLKTKNRNSIQNQKLRNYQNFFKQKKQENPENLEKNEIISLKSFNILFLIGEGAFGQVFLVSKKSNNQLFAMKAINKEKVKNNLVKYAKAERNILTIMDHPFILKLYYSFQTDTHLYLILEYCSGGTLGEVLYKHETLSEDIVRMYAAEILLGIQVLHDKGVIYRDLKPSNVLIDQDGHMKIADFGLAKEGVFNQMSSSFCGSTAYYPPEMLQKMGHNKSIDWYHFGVLLYELLVGYPAYYSEQDQQIHQNILYGQLHMPQNISKEAKDLIISLLNRTPDQRIGSKKGAEEIKKHRFFKKINWNDVINKQQQLPTYKYNLQYQNQIQQHIDQLHQEQQNSFYVEDWSFSYTQEYI